MSKGLDPIKKFLSYELDHFEDHFKESMATKVALFDKIMHYIAKSKGKQVRPMLVFLSARMFGDSNDNTFVGASMVELLHTATLVHDDVVDDAYQRRGFFSINALWKNKIAVLVGDYLLSKGLLLSLDHKQYGLLHILSNAVKEMAEGELLQIEKARRLDIVEDIYFDIISKKTASLIAASCGVGAATVINDEEKISQMVKLGTTIGICFQIKDDLFDYGNSNIGKPVGIDIKEKKMTLPLIHALQNCSNADKKRVINLIKNKSSEDSAVKEVINFVKEHHGIEYTQHTMNEYYEKAIGMLDQFEKNEATEHFKTLIEYVIRREK